MNVSKRAVVHAQVATDDLNGCKLSAQVEASQQYTTQAVIVGEEDGNERGSGNE